MPIEVRQAVAENAFALATVEIASWREAYEGLMPAEFLDGLSLNNKSDGWRANLHKHGPAGHKRVLVAVSGEGIIGFVRVGVDDAQPRTGLVYLLYVLPDYWGAGVGKRLMGAAMEELRGMGVGEAVLWVLRKNERARAFYEGLGWRPDGRTAIETFGGVELEAWCYRRDI